MTTMIQMHLYWIGSLEDSSLPVSGYIGPTLSSNDCTRAIEEEVKCSQVFAHLIVNQNPLIPPVS